MKLKLLFLSIPLFAIATLQAQAPVPTSWNCDALSSLPAGWTLNNTIGGSGQFYTGPSQTCEGGGSVRLDFDLEYLEIHTSSQPGRVVYSLIGTGSGTWAGIFSVQESPDGVNWNTLKTYTTGQLGTSPACDYDSVMPSNPAIRYIRFYYDDKMTGFNTALDDVKIRAAVTTSQKLQVKQNNVQVVNNSYAAPFNAPVGTPTPVNFSLLNIGTVNALNVTNISFTGPNASEFSVTSPSLPTTINALSNTPLVLSFNPAAIGTRRATMTIKSNDPTEDSLYVIELYGVGGNFATEPSAQATGLTFDANKTYRVITSFSASNPVPDVFGGYIAFRSIGAPLSTPPADGSNYKVGEYVGNGKVVFIGEPGDPTYTMIHNGYEASTQYYYTIFTFNGGGSPYVNYNTNSPLSNQTTTPATMAAPGEYSTVDVNNANFVTQLHSVVNPHSSVFYSNYRITMINGFEAKDTLATVGPLEYSRYFYCSYSRNEVLFNEPFDFTATGTSREHSFPHSWMPTWPADSPEKPEYNDQHNLYPAIQVGVNDVRCNYPFGEVVTVISSEGQSKFGLDAAGNRVFEPADIHKGRAARALMYMTICYNSIGGNSWNFDAPIGENCNGVYTMPVGQDQDLIKKWHFEHLPDNYDMARNDFLDSLQNNRNPFVDNPNYACYIDFQTMTYISNPTFPCYVLGNKTEANAVNFTVFPNPSTDAFQVSIWGEQEGEALISLLDMSGKIVYSSNQNMVQGNNTYSFNPDIAAGVYFIKILTPSGSGIMKFVKE